MSVFSDNIAKGFKGYIGWSLRNALTGEEIMRGEWHPNTVTMVGRRHVLNMIKSDSPSTDRLSYIAVGTGTTAPSTADTTLASELTRKAIGTVDVSGTTANPPYFDNVVSFATNEANGTIGEFGQINSSSGGTLINRVTTATFEKATSNTLTITGRNSG